jgi:hypothetical protein
MKLYLSVMLTISAVYGAPVLDEAKAWMQQFVGPKHDVGSSVTLAEDGKLSIKAKDLIASGLNPSTYCLFIKENWYAHAKKVSKGSFQEDEQKQNWVAEMKFDKKELKKNASDKAKLQVWPCNAATKFFASRPVISEIPVANLFDANTDNAKAVPSGSSTDKRAIAEASMPHHSSNLAALQSVINIDPESVVPAKASKSSTSNTVSDEGLIGTEDKLQGDSNQKKAATIAQPDSEHRSVLRGHEKSEPIDIPKSGHQIGSSDNAAKIIADSIKPNPPSHKDDGEEELANTNNNAEEEGSKDQENQHDTTKNNNKTSEPPEKRVQEESSESIETGTASSTKGGDSSQIEDNAGTANSSSD